MHEYNIFLHYNLNHEGAEVDILSLKCILLIHESSLRINKLIKKAKKKKGNGWEEHEEETRGSNLKDQRIFMQQ